MNAPIQHSPFKFLDSYTLKDADLFFGRDQEVEEAYSKVFQSKILLVYGASGTGKSSLINCGLANKFSASDWLPISVRRGGNILRSLNYQLERLSYQDRGFEKPNDPSKEEILASIQSVFLDHFKPIYLIFDQFEELFIFGDKDEWQAFTETISYLLESELDLHFIFVVRGDYLEYLSEFEKAIPGFFDNRLRVEPMRPSQARHSITGPCELANIQLEEGFEDHLLHKLDSKNHRIEPTFLQVFLDKVYKHAKTAAGDEGQIQFKKADVEDLGAISDVLAEFVDEQIFQMPKPKLAWSVLKSYVSLDGTKIPQKLEEVQHSLEQLQIKMSRQELEDIIAELVNKRILKGQDEEGRHELRHDSLALKIYERISLQEKERLELQRFLNISLAEYQKRGTLLKEEDLDYLRSHQRKLELNEEMESFIKLSQKQSSRAKRKKQNQRIIGALILLLALSSLYGWYYSQGEKARADQAAQIAQAESEKAQAQKIIAEEERGKAEASAQIALEEKAKAEAAKEIAQQESSRAKTAEANAVQEQLKAIQEREKALESEAKAQTQKDLADAEKAKAERLSQIALNRQLALQSQQVAYPLNAQLALNAYRQNRLLKDYPEQADLFQALLMAYRSSGELRQLQHSYAFERVWHREGKSYFFDKNKQLFQLGQNQTSLIQIPLPKGAENLWPLDEDMALIKTQKELIIYNFKAESIVKKLSFQGDIEALEVMGKDIVFLQAKQGHHLNLETLKIAAFGEGNVLDIAASADQLVLLKENGELIDWQSKLIMAKSSFKANIIRLSPDGRYLAMGDQSGSVRVLNLSTGSEIQLSNHLSAINDLRFSADGQNLASASMDRSVKLWSLSNLLERPKEYRGLNYWMQHLRFAGSELLCTSYEGDIYFLPTLSKNLAERICAQSLPVMSPQDLNTYSNDIELNPMPCHEN